MCVLQIEFNQLISWYSLCVCGISYLHCASRLNLQSDEQQRSSLRWRSPGSHSSPSSTLEFPHTLLFLSLKHIGALKRNVFPTEILLQLENCFKRKEMWMVFRSTPRRLLLFSKKWSASSTAKIQEHPRKCHSVAKHKYLLKYLRDTTQQWCF